MPRFIAFLRAINVGGHIVKMERLRGLFEELDFTAVETFIASGNVIFDTPARTTARVEATIEAHLGGALGYEVETFLRTPAELAKIAAYRPFADTALGGKDTSLFIAFVREAPPPGAARRLAALRSDTDDFKISGREIYWLRRGGFSAPGVTGALLEKTTERCATVRNVTTVRKLAAKCAARGE
jgi:uncharacterized protein (DUF1697 family)